MANAEKLRECILDEYGEHFDAWLVDLKKNNTYWGLVDGYEENWIKIYEKLNRIFKETYWHKRKLDIGTSTVEDDVWRRITDTQLNAFILRRYFKFAN